jgi:citrate synthase
VHGGAGEQAMALYADIAARVEAAIARARPVPTNIDRATAVLFAELGFLPPLGRGLFLLSRAVGIPAQAWEQQQQGARIKGPMPPEFLYRYEGSAPRPLPDADADRQNRASGAE